MGRQRCYQRLAAPVVFSGDDLLPEAGEFAIDSHRCCYQRLAGLLQGYIGAATDDDAVGGASAVELVRGRRSRPGLAKLTPAMASVYQRGIMGNFVIFFGGSFPRE